MRLLIGIALVWFGGISWFRLLSGRYDNLEGLAGLVGLILAAIGLLGLIFGWGI